jgi:toxin CptA
MGPQREPPTLLIRPRFSRRLAAFVVLTHLAALAAVLALPDPRYRLLAILVTGSLAYQVYVRVLGRAPWSIRSVTWQADGTWQILLRSGAEIAAAISPATFVSVPLVVLNLRLGPWRRWSLPLFSDALDPEQLRRLRQRLRIAGSGGDADPAP